MPEIVTLELSEEVAKRAREIARRSGRPVEAILTEWLERSAGSAAAQLLTPDTEYAIFTPYGNEAAAQTLLDFLNAAEAADTQAEHTP